MGTSTGPFLLVHKCVRNDNHCPTCRCYTLSLHPTRSAAIAKGVELICTSNEHSNVEAEVRELETTGSTWVDEWVRRSNGDWYQVQRVALDTVYPLQHLTRPPWTATDVLEACDTSVPGVPDIRFLLLHIVIDRTEWCPDNIRFEVSLHATVEAANDAASIDAKSLCKASSGWREALLAKQPVWLQVWKNFFSNDDDDDESSSGTDEKADAEVQETEFHHYQIIAVNDSVTPAWDLNGFCKQLQPKVWEQWKHRRFTS